MASSDRRTCTSAVLSRHFLSRCESRPKHTAPNCNPTVYYNLCPKGVCAPLTADGISPSEAGLRVFPGPILPCSLQLSLTTPNSPETEATMKPSHEHCRLRVSLAQVHDSQTRLCQGSWPLPVSNSMSCSVRPHGCRAMGCCFRSKATWTRIRAFAAAPNFHPLTRELPILKT